MRVRFTFKHMETSKGLIEIAESKFENLMRRFKPSPQRVHVVVDTDGPLVKVHATMVTNKGKEMEAVVRGENAYSLIDLLVQKLDGQLRRQKERLKLQKFNGQSKLRHIRQEGRRMKYSGNGGFWEQTPIDASDILRLSAEARGPINSSRAS